MSDYGDDWKKDPPPIKRKRVSCHAAKCEDDLHCFRTDMRKKASRLEKTYRSESCIKCGKDIINWKRIDKKNLNDIDHLIKSLKKEYVRYTFWKEKIEPDDINKAKKKGLNQLRNEIKKRIEKSIGPPSNQIFRDGTQTPYEGNVIFSAQYATATCCRKCVEEWYDIDRNEPLTKNEKEYFETIILKFITERIPRLSDEGISK